MTNLLTRPLETASVGYPLTRAGISLFPVYLHQPGSGLDYVSGVTALRDGRVRIDETPGGTVSTLRVVSDLDRPTLIPEGDTVVGGLQNRIVNVSILIAAGYEGTLPVSCVEAGRWGDRHTFTHGDSFASRRVRRTTTRTVTDDITTHGTRHTDQSAVWSAVDSELDRWSVPSGTRALHDIGSHTAHLVEELAAAGPLPEQHGVIVSFGRRVVSVDLFERPEVLADYWRAIVRGLAPDAGREYGGTPSASAALRFLHRIARADSVEHPGVGLGTEVRMRSHRVEAQALRVDETLVHLSAQAA